MSKNNEAVPFYPIYEYLTRTHEQTFPKDVVYAAKRSIMNTIGLMIAGARLDSLQSLLKYAEKGSGRCTIATMGNEYSPATAALYNGIASHSLDMDDCSYCSFTHPSAVLVPALMALGEYIDASGEDILRAYIGGTVVGTYFGRYCGELVHKAGWHATSVMMTPIAALACGILLDLNEVQFKNLFGASTSLSFGMRANFGSGTKPLHVGIAAQNAVQAALFAKAGLTSSESALTGAEGFLKLFCGIEYDEKKALGLASCLSEFELVNPGFYIKGFPSCSSNHQATCAMYDILKEFPEITADCIESIEIYTNKQTLLELVTPYPATPDEARFSPGFHIALAILREEIEPKSFTLETINRPEVQRIIHMTKLIYASEFDKIPGVDRWPACVHLKLKDGRTIKRMRLFADGDTSCPFSDDKLKQMFFDTAKDYFNNEEIDKLYDTLNNFESMRSIHQLTDLLAKEKENILDSASSNRCSR